ncbi:restriction endonuclease subunit S [Nostoc sp.]|uniref:restriction endonuclease subunit S n=1 Tax=Nostoc sp. TaxID=1180 RepID=UPI002FF7B6D2
MSKKLKKNVPQLRFPEFEGDWKESKLNKLINLISGQHLSPNEYSLEIGEVPYFTGPSDFTNQVEALTKWTALSDKSGQQGDILITVKGNGVGEMLMLKLPNVVIGRQLMAIRPITVVGEIVYYKLFNYKQELQALASGNVIPGLSRSALLNIKIYLPNIAEQEKIASFLGAVDTRLNQLRRKWEILQTYKRGVIQKIFSQKIRFQDANDSPFPDWEKKKLREITKINQGLQIAISDRLTYQVEGSYFYITNEFLKPDSQTRYYILNPPKRVICEKDDILMTRTGNTGQVVTDVVGAFHNNFFKISYDRNKINKKFLLEFLRRYTTQHKILSLAGTSTIPDLNHDDFYNLEIFIPVSVEQEKIANFLTAIDCKIEILTRQIDQTEQFKKGLLQKMFV